ncbi:hypothetical protein FACS1894152_8610 [Bacilli bacterium]|nr:hypothetical protein FACS1894152_8610 [Bacilli bacterium]
MDMEALVYNFKKLLRLNETDLVIAFNPTIANYIPCSIPYP